MRSMKFQLRVFALALLATLAGLAGAAPLKFDIPAQPAPAALMMFSRQAGVEVVYSYDDLGKVQANEVVGEFEPEEAIARLLRRTGFTARRNGAGKFTVVPDAPVRGTIRGVVRRAGSHEPVARARVGVPGTTWVTTTADDGSFELTGVPSGRMTVGVQADGFVPARVAEVRATNGSTIEIPAIELTVASEGVEQLDEYHISGEQLLVGTVYSLENFVVTPSRFGVAEGPALPVATLTHRDLEIMPQLGEDLYRAIGRLPGLATMDFTAKFWVRGAPNNQMLARLDGATLLEPFHMKDIDGALSIVDIETVARLDLTSGGFSAEYGDRLAGVLVMETESHLEPKPHTTLGISLTGARATNRGTFADGRGNWLVSARMGYPDIAINEAGSDSQLTPRYYDVFAKAEYQPWPGQVFALHLLHSGDTLKVTGSDGQKLKSSYGDDYVWARWRGEFGEKLKGEAVLSYAALDWHRQGAGQIDRFLPFDLSDDRRLNLAALRQDWSLLLTDRALFRTGFEVQEGEAEYRYHRLRSLNLIRNGDLVIEPRVLDRNLETDGESGGAYAALRFQPQARLTLEPGLRFDRHDSGAGEAWSPRFNAALDLGRAKVRVAWGRYRQEQGLHEIGVMDGESTLHPAELAEQRVIGLESRLGPRVNFRAEWYQRITKNPRPHGENPFNVGDSLGELLSDRVLLHPTHAEANGMELIFESRGQKVFNWSANYVWARTTETLGDRVVPRDRDQRHTFHFDLGWHPNPRWQFTAAWQYHTGWPTTGKVFTYFTLNDGREATVGSSGPLYAERLPPYHRLDLRVTRLYTLKHSTLRVFLDVFNAYNHKNTLFFQQNPLVANDGSLTTRKNAETLLPLLPSVGLIWDF